MMSGSYHEPSVCGQNRSRNDGNGGLCGTYRILRQYGVIRDVFQNHLSEMLALILSDVPVSPENRLESLRNVQIDRNEITIGQYDEYQSHVDEDRKRWDEDDVGKRTFTTTCALVKLFSSEKRWSDVPIYLYSGKAAYPRKRGMIPVISRTVDFFKSYVGDSLPVTFTLNNNNNINRFFKGNLTVRVWWNTRTYRVM